MKKKSTKGGLLGMFSHVHPRLPQQPVELSTDDGMLVFLDPSYEPAKGEIFASAEKLRPG